MEMVSRGAMESAMHMVDGLVSAPNDINRILEVWDNGCIELYRELSDYAIIAAQLYKEGIALTGGVPGVFDYEVPYEFGEWFGKYIVTRGDGPSRQEGEAELSRLNVCFWNQFDNYLKEEEN